MAIEPGRGVRRWEDRLGGVFGWKCVKFVEGIVRVCLRVGGELRRRGDVPTTLADLNEVEDGEREGIRDPGAGACAPGGRRRERGLVDGAAEMAGRHGF